MKLLISWVLVALTAVHARTAVRQQTIDKVHATRIPRMRIPEFLKDDSEVTNSTGPYTLSLVVMECPLVVKDKLIPNFTQEDLTQYRMYLLFDTSNGHAYVWVGYYVDPYYLLFATRALANYQPDWASNGQKITKITMLRQGEESPGFLKAFDKWDNDLWKKREKEREKLMASESTTPDDDDDDDDDPDDE